MEVGLHIIQVQLYLEFWLEDEIIYIKIYEKKNMDLGPLWGDSITPHEGPKVQKI